MSSNYDVQLPRNLQLLLNRSPAKRAVASFCTRYKTVILFPLIVIVMTTIFVYKNNTTQHVLLLMRDDPPPPVRLERKPKSLLNDPNRRLSRKLPVSHVFVVSAYYYAESKSLGKNAIALNMAIDSVSKKLDKAVFTIVGSNSTNTTSSTAIPYVENADMCRYSTAVAITKTIENLEKLELESDGMTVEIPFKHARSSAPKPVIFCMAPQAVGEQWQLFVLQMHLLQKYGAHTHVYLVSMLEPYFDLMQEYEKQGYATIEPWLRMKVSSSKSQFYEPNGNVELGNRAGAFTDCLLQYKEAAQYIAFIDIADLLFPVMKNSYLKEFHAEFKFHNSDSSIYYKRKGHELVKPDTLAEFSFSDAIDSLKTVTSSKKGIVVVKPHRWNSTGIYGSQYETKRNRYTVRNNYVVQIQTPDKEVNVTIRSYNSTMIKLRKKDFLTIEKDFLKIKNSSRVRGIARTLPMFDYYTLIIEECFDEIVKFRRILPLYYLAVLLITIMVHMFLGDFLWQNNDRYSLASLIMATNQLVIHDQADYFNQFRASLDSINLFLHLWSLSVEMQFYLFVPIIFFGLKFLKNDYLKIWKSATLVYVGDISYVLYLVHWPVISMFLAPTINSYIFCILTVFIVSIFVHHIFEKQYLKLGMRDVFLLIFLLIGANAYVQYSVRNDNFWAMDLPAETQEVVDRNIVASQTIWLKEPRKARCIETSIEVPFNQYYLGGFCRYPRGTGNMSILVIGNSYVVNLVEKIRAPFNKNYSDFRYLSVYSSFGLYSGFTEQSKEALNFTKQQVEKFKPDVLFVVARYLETIKDPVQKNDPLVRQMEETIEFYEKFVKKIYILGAHPTYKENFLDTFLQYLVTMPHNLDILHLDKNLADDEMRSVRERFAEVKCKKCRFFDLSHLFVEGNKYLTFDKQTLIAYVDNAVHLTTAGAEMCDPVFKKVAKEIINAS
ncbi:hypothetical protein B9Z55_018090 [Caenorhabditis nigoni]|uniref:PI-PLC Y-box domain-containing protein n=1 Tax=Caenorhabditis nigoni TaxID=1611254 RepID=A0A2G5TCQ2_9PELO|nr:hypothetical protein B9Z55_018090 [Caenorhabditis nigoni]